MTQEEKEQVAILDGWEYENEFHPMYENGYWINRDRIGTYSLDDLNYTTDMRQIIHVCEKIEELRYSVVIRSSSVRVYNEKDQLLIDADQYNTFIENTSDAIAAFAVWYNKQQKDGDK